MLKGWANYFRLGSVSKAYESVDSHVRNRLRQWVATKAQDKGTSRETLHRHLSLSTAWSNLADPLSDQPAVGEG
jgi:hypothetical protein